MEDLAPTPSLIPGRGCRAFIQPLPADAEILPVITGSPDQETCPEVEVHLLVASRPGEDRQVVRIAVMRRQHNPTREMQLISPAAPIGGGDPDEILTGEVTRRQVAGSNSAGGTVPRRVGVALPFLVICPRQEQP